MLIGCAVRCFAVICFDSELMLMFDVLRVCLLLLFMLICCLPFDVAVACVRCL